MLMISSKEQVDISKLHTSFINHSHLTLQLNSSPKTMPITPTVARIKSDPTNASPSGVLSSASLISPDLQRVKVEIGASIRPPHHHHQLPAAMAMQQLQSADQPHFISPRKRMSMENGSSPVPMKKHRLSTDSRGSGGSDGANGPHSPSAAAGHNPLSFGNRSSPLRASYPTSKSPFHHHLAASAAAAAAAASPPRAAPRSNFSIDSIISGRGEENHSSRSGSPSIRSGTPLIRPVPLPASPARVNSYGDGSRSPTPMTAIKPHPARSPPNINIMSYAERNHPAAAALSLHPHLAHLAGVSADPKLGLNPIPGSPAATASAAAAAFQPSSPYPNPPALAAVQAAQAAHAAQAAQAQAHAQAAANQSVITALYQSALLSQNPALAAQLLQHLPDGGAASAFKQVRDVKRQTCPIIWLWTFCQETMLGPKLFQIASTWCCNPLADLGWADLHFGCSAILPTGRPMCSRTGFC